MFSGNSHRRKWFIDFAVYTTACSDYLRQPRLYFPASHPATRGDLGERDYVFTRPSILDFIYLRIFVCWNEGRIYVTAKSIRI